MIAQGQAPSPDLHAFPSLRPLLAPAGCGVAGLVAAGAVMVMGPAAAVVPLAIAVIAAALAWPGRFLVVLIAAGVVIDPAQVGITASISKALWEFPPGVAAIMPITTNPYEVLLALCAVGLALRPAYGPAPAKLPAILWAAPLVILLGFGYGFAQGGQLNVADHEARGLIFGAVLFFATWRMRGFAGQHLLRFTLIASIGLALNTVFRYMVYLKSGAVDLPKESWFAHETGLFLSLAFIIGCGLLLRARGSGERWALVAYTALMLVALAMTGRRSAVLVLILGALVMAWLLLPKRPALLIGISIPVLLVSAGYLGAYWNDGTDAIGEPARAVRSQVSPDARDKSSDEYRAIEKYDIEQTLKQSPIFGVGFGRPFTQIKELPLLDFWPLQSYTPHENILWLWLKTGIVGASVLLGLWLVAFRRCVSACRAVGRGLAVPARPMILAAGLLMYLGYGSVDLAFVGSRSMSLLAIMLALAFMLPATNSTEGAPAAEALV